MIDTVLYTLHGPVLHDPTFPDPANSGKLLACTWMAHRPSNELLATYLLNRAGDYAAFTQAIRHFECPAQNIAYADGAGNIAMWAQGRFINKWKGQGKFVMRGDDSSTLWGESIPMAENPHVLNPVQGYVASANQSVTDSTYPYWYNGSFVEWRSWEINRMIPMKATIENMKEMQNNTFSWLQMFSTPAIRSRIDSTQLIIAKKKFGMNATEAFNFNYFLEASKGPYAQNATFHQILWSQLYKNIWQDEFAVPPLAYPSSERTVQLLLGDSTSSYYDDKNTQQVETLRDIVQRAFKETTDSLEKLTKSESTSQQVNESTSQRANDSTSPLAWYKVKNTTLTHLARIPAFSYSGLKIGGWSNTINAVTGNHGPSWRMIVEMDSIPKAYAVYPGGQSGNPGSPYYGDFIDHWVEGKYFTIQFLTTAITKNPFKYTWTLTP
jgi:penicillin amidase